MNESTNGTLRYRVEHLEKQVERLETMVNRMLFAFVAAALSGFTAVVVYALG